MEEDLQKQCQELLEKLKNNQATLRQSLVLGTRSDRSSLENNLTTQRTEGKPEYARQKLRSIMKQKNGQSNAEFQSGLQEKKINKGQLVSDQMANGVDSTYSKSLLSHLRSEDEVQKLKDHDKKELSYEMGVTLNTDTHVNDSESQDGLKDAKGSSVNPIIIDDQEETGTNAGEIIGLTMALQAIGSDKNVNSASKSVTPNSYNRRHIIDKHVHVESNLSEADLQELEKNVRGLNFSYSEALADNMMAKESLQEPETEEGNMNNNCSAADNKGKEASLSYHKSLLDGGNNRQLNNFIKDTTIKPKSLLNSTQSLQNSYSKQGPGVSFQSNASSSSNGALFHSQAKDRRMLGYDWIAALIQSDAGFMDESESYFNDMKEFRRSNRDECSNDFYMEGPFTLTETEPPQVEQAIKDTKVQPFTVNDRLFTVPVKENLLGEPIDKGDTKDQAAEPSKDNPRFVRVSIPRATLQMPYKRRPHRRRSFDASDSCSLTEHCLMGWSAVSPATLPTASGVSLSDAVTGVNPKHATTMAEAEKTASAFHWPLLEPPHSKGPGRLLGSGRPGLCTTATQFPHPDASSLSLPLSMSSSGLGRVLAEGRGDLRLKTSALLDSTYSMMYQMQKTRQQREEQLRKESGKAAS